MNGRASDLQRQLQDSNNEKNRLDDRIIHLEKVHFFEECFFIKKFKNLTFYFRINFEPFLLRL